MQDAQHRAVPDHRRAKFLRACGGLAGVATVALGLVVIVGWYLGDRTLIQVLPQFVPMQYNTALGFVLGGLALTMRVAGCPRIAAAFGAATALIGGLTLVEYVGGVSLGIDELFMKHDITTKTSHPGRMAPNTATCFMLLGLSGVLRHRRERPMRQSVLTVVLGSLTFGLAMVALSGYVMGLETAYGWGNLTRMAVHTSVGFVVVSSGLLCFVWSRDTRSQLWIPDWMPIPLGIAILTATVCLWQALNAESIRIHREHADITSIAGLAILMLVVGVLLAIAMALVVFLAQQSSRRARSAAGANKALHQAQAALESLNRDLEAKVEGRTSELAEAEERSRLLLESAGEGIFGTNAEGRVTFANPAALRMLGYEADDFLGHEVHRLIHHSHNDGSPYPLQQCPMYKSYTQGENGDMDDEVLWRRDGSSFSVHYISTPVRKDGELVGSVITFGDITERKQAEEALQEAKERAEDATRAKSDFLANMSHEIRTPMNGIIGMTDLTLDTHLTLEQRDYLNTVKISADALLSLINDILDFSKIEAGKLELEPVDFALRDSLADMLNTLANRAHSKGLELAYEVPAETHDTLIGDVYRLRQVVMNLVGNAIKFTQQGEIVVSVVQVQRTDQNATLHFSTRDTGIGIPPGKLESIFKPFEQADASTTRQFGGTGLGLAISVELVDLMGGRMWAESEPGRGSTFHFTVVFGLGEAAPTPVVQERRELLDGLPVLVVDDNATNRQILDQMLKNWQMAPQSVADGAAALAALDRAAHAGTPYRLVLSDVNMPEMDGFMLFESTRSNPQHRDVPFVLLTSAARPGDMARCREIGVAAHLIKPVKQSLLLNAIVSAVAAEDVATADGATAGVATESHTTASPTSTSKAGRILRVLLAEDNEVNQKFAVRAIEKAGHAVVVANNGIEAVDTWERDQFDVILMDVQMPELDGLAATARIRELEQQRGMAQRMPIIAMTANAMKGDRELCLEAGMDGYVSKPVKRQVLFDEIDRVLGTR